jgi:hypothetical protein
MSTAIILEPRDFDKLINELKETLRDELKKVRHEVRESPMTKKETARYLKCHVNTVDKNWTHLRHLVAGTPYWFASEIENELKNS